MRLWLKECRIRCGIGLSLAQLIYELKAQPSHTVLCAMSNTAWVKMLTNTKFTATAMPHSYMAKNSFVKGFDSRLTDPIV